MNTPTHIHTHSLCYTPTRTLSNTLEWIKCIQQKKWTDISNKMWGDCRLVVYKFSRNYFHNSFLLVNFGDKLFRIPYFWSSSKHTPNPTKIGANIIRNSRNKSLIIWNRISLYWCIFMMLIQVYGDFVSSSEVDLIEWHSKNSSNVPYTDAALISWSFNQFNNLFIFI